MFQATQNRPRYWDNLPHARRALDGGNGDWRMSNQLLTRDFDTVQRAVSWARRVLGQRPGCPVDIWQVTDGHRTKQTRIAVVLRDALGRTWTDLMTWEPLL